MVNQKGFELLVQILSLKIYDEKRNEKQPSRKLDFYIKKEERFNRSSFLFEFLLVNQHSL